MRRRDFMTFGLAATGLVLAGRAPAAGEVSPLRLGIMPFNSAMALLKTHQPLREHLGRSLQRPVDVFTSADYVTFLNDSRDGQYDLLITGPHFAVINVDNGYVPLYRYRATLQPILVVHRHSGITGVAGLKGKRIGLSSRLSMSSIGGTRWLEEHGLKMGRDFRISERATHGAAIAAVSVGDLDAAITTFTPLNQVPEDVRNTLAVLPTDIRVPHLMTLAHRRLGAPAIGRIRLALRAFETSPAGQSFFKETGYLGYDEITPDDLKVLQPYVALTRSLLGVAE